MHYWAQHEPYTKYYLCNSHNCNMYFQPPYNNATNKPLGIYYVIQIYNHIFSALFVNRQMVNVALIFCWQCITLIYDRIGWLLSYYC
jgi:tryptophan-rich sensory protein